MTGEVGPLVCHYQNIQIIIHMAAAGEHISTFVFHPHKYIN